MTTRIPELDDPLIVAGQWLDEAVARATQPNPTAMTLATVDRHARPSARVVLVKRLDRDNGYAEFFTNYGSRKAAEIGDSPWAAGVMHWDHLGRQLRFEGPVVKSPPAASDAYFATRPWRSRINARVSEQSRHLDDPRTLERRARQLAAELGVPDPFGTDEPAAPVTIERPDDWGGFRLWLAAIELWASGTDRFHERLRYARSLEPADASGFVTGAWSHVRLQP